MRTADELVGVLRRIDGAGYGAYHDIEGSFTFGGGDLAPFTLHVDHVQSDPFASPSRVHVTLPVASVGGFPAALYSTKTRMIAMCDFLTRAFVAEAERMGVDNRVESGGWGGAKGGEMRMDRPGQHVLERTSVLLEGDQLEARFNVALPARGRTVMGAWAAEVLTDSLPRLVRASLLFRSIDGDALRAHVLSVEDQEAAREQLAEAGLVAFVRNGAVLPRASGVDDRPMSARDAVPFESPETLRCSLAVPNAGEIVGMGLKRGVSLIVGGGFHGKSTLLKALEVGIYNHVPGDGREFVVCDAGCTKIRAEDGRPLLSVDISGFINNLPLGKGTDHFTTADASGSTSQAGNIVEMLEAGSTSLLIDVSRSRACTLPGSWLTLGHGLVAFTGRYRCHELYDPRPPHADVGRPRQRADHPIHLARPRVVRNPWYLERACRGWCWRVLRSRRRCRADGQLPAV